MSATRSRWSSPRTATPPRTRSSSSSRTSRCSTPIVTYEDALDETKPPLFDEFADNVAFAGDMSLGDIDAVFDRADQVVRASIDVHRHEPVPMECRGLIADWDAAAEHLTIHASTQSPHMYRMLLPPQINVPMEQIRVLADDVGGGFGLKNGVAREDVAVVAAAIDLGRPVKWIEDRLEHLATGGQAREEMADIEAAVTADGVLLGLRMDAKLNIGAYACDPFPGAIYVMSLSGSFQGPTKIEAISAHHTAVFSNKATYVAYRGPVGHRRLPARAHARRDRRASSGSTRSTSAVATTSTAASRRSRMLTGQPFVGVTTQNASNRRRRSSTGTASGAARRKRRPRAATSGSASRRTSRRHPVPDARAGGRTPDPRRRGHPHLASRTTGSVSIITRQQPHGQGHETTLAQVAADELGVQVRGRARRVRRHRHHADRAGRHGRQPGGHDGERRRAARVASAAREDRCRSRPTCSRPTPTTSRSAVA